MSFRSFPSYILLTLFVGSLAGAEMASRPISFEENLGQFGRGSNVSYVARGGGYRMEFGAAGVSFVFPEGGRVGMELGEQGRWATPVVSGPLVMRSNYLRSQDPGKWVAGARHFERVTYRQVYPGIDLQFVVNGRAIEYDFVVAPGANPAMIALSFPGARSLAVTPEGDLLLRSGSSEMRHRRPIVYQESATGRAMVPASLQLEGDKVRISLGTFRRDRALVIDPVMEASTLIGGGGEDRLLAVAADSAGNMYVTGLTDSAAAAALPTTAGAKQTANGGATDAFVAKIAPDGKTFLYVTYLGGTGEDYAESIAVDGAGNVVVAGTTRSPNFPVTAGAVQTQFGDLRSQNPSPDAFVAKLNSTGTALLFSTFLGRSGYDVGHAVRLDANENVYVAGSTASPDFTTTDGAYQRTLRGTSDAFLVKLNPAGTAILYSTLYGGSSDDEGSALGVDSTGAAVFAGSTSSFDLAQVGTAFQSSPAKTSLYVAKLNAAGSALVFSNYLGSSNNNLLGNLGLDNAGNVYVTGTSAGLDFPVTLPVPGTAGITGPFLSKIGPNGGPLLYSMVLQCGVTCNGKDVAVEPGGRVHWTGFTGSDNLETRGDALMPFRQFNATAAYLVRVETTGQILDSTYWYGSGNRPGPFVDPSFNSTTTSGNSIALVAPGVVVVGGTTTALRFPVSPGAAQTAIQGTNRWESYVSKISYVSSCTYAVSTELINVPAAGASTVVNVTTAPGCPLLAMPSDEWVSAEVLNASQLRVTVPPSSMISRTAAVFLGGKTIIVQQGSGCTYAVREKVVAVPAGGKYVEGYVDTGFACPWKLSSDASWLPLNLTNSSTNYGPQSFVLNVLVNQYPAARTGTLTIAPDVTVTFEQAAATCTYNVEPLSLSVSALQQTPTVAVTTQPGCNWLKEEAPSWMEVAEMVGGEGTGSGAARLFFYSNEGAPRTGTVRVAGKLVTVTQSGTVVGLVPDALPTFVSSYTANPQTFSFGGRDGDGLANLDRIYFLVHTASTPAAGTCFGYYDVGQNSLYLYDNAGTATVGPLAPGAGSTLQNSQCSISGAGFSRDSVTSSDVSVTVGITRLGSFAAGAKTFYLLARDKDGNDKGWQASGSWNPIGSIAVPPSVVPTADTYSGPLFSQTITARDGNGFADIRRVYFLMNTNTSVAGATCHGFYDRVLNTFVLYNDTLTGLIGPLAAGGGTIQNSQCSITSSGPNPIRGTGTDLVFELGIGVLGDYGATPKKLYALAQDNSGTDSGWVELATVAIAGAGPNQAPTVVSVNPANPVGSPQPFVLTARDPNGFANIDRVYFLVNPNTSVPALTCHGFYDKATQAFYLYDDGLTRLLGPLFVNSGEKRSNSQCEMDGSVASQATGSGTDLTMRIGLLLKGGYGTTAKNVYWWVQDAGGLGTGWVLTGTWTPGAGAVSQPPSVVVGTPLSVTGSPQAIPLVGRDPNGYPNIDRVYFLVNGNTSIPANTCHGFWDRAANALYLYSDGLTALQGPLTPGGGGTLTNGQCTLSGATSTPVRGTGNDLTVTLGLSLNGTYAASSKNIYAWVVDAENNGTGWVQAGVWAPSAAVPSQPPAIFSATPVSPAGSPQTFTVVARDPNGFANLQRLYFLVNPNTSIPTGTCHGYYDRAVNAFYLYNDALTALAGPLAPGAAGTLSNGQCTIQGAGSTPVSGTGTDLTVTLAIGLNGTYGSTAKNVYFWAQDSDNNGTGWVQTATWTPGGGGMSPIPVLVSGSPAVPTAATQTFSFIGRDGNGYANLQRVYFLVNTTATVPTGTCHGFYDRAANAFYLYNDGLTGLLGPLAPGAAGELQNSQCVIRGADSTPVAGIGTDLTVTLGLTLKAPYSASSRNVYVWIQDVDGNGTGWLQTSVWNAGAGNAAPTVVAATPGTVAGSPQTVMFASRDGNGFADIRRIYFLVSSGQAQVTANGCHGFYDRAANALYLYDDSLGGLLGPLTPGQAGTIQNGQCSLQGTGTSVASAAGSDLTLAVQMSLRGSFTGSAKKLFLVAQDAAGADSGWVQVLNWNP